MDVFGYSTTFRDCVPRWEMTWVPVGNGLEGVYSTVLQKVNYGGQQLNVREQAGKLTRVIFDSGSSYTYFPHELYTSLIASVSFCINSLHLVKRVQLFQCCIYLITIL